MDDDGNDADDSAHQRRDGKPFLPVTRKERVEGGHASFRRGRDYELARGKRAKNETSLQ